MKKSLLFGLLAVFAAVFIFTACDNGTTTETIQGPEREVVIEIEYIPDTTAQLAAALAGDDYKVIGITSNSTAIDLSALYSLGPPLVNELVIPAGKTVYVVDGGALNAVNNFTLTIDGELVIGLTGKVIVESGDLPIAVRDGSITVLEGGLLDLRRIKDINDGAATKPQTVVGTSKVTVKGGTLNVSSIPEVADLQTAFASIESGLLEILGAKSFKPSDVTSIGTITEDKRVTMSVTAIEDATSLTIPKGLTLTSSSNLATVESLTVEGTLKSVNTNPVKLATLVVAEDGTFEARGNFALLTSLTVDGTFKPGAGSNLAALKTLIVNGTVDTTGSLPLGTLTVTVGETGTLNLVAATLEGESVIDGALDLVGDVALAADAVLAIDETKVSGSGVIKTTGAGSSITFVGYGSGYTADATNGVAGNDIEDALEALEKDLETVATVITLDSSFGNEPGNTIGTVTLSSTGETKITNDTNGGTGTAEIKLSANSEFEGTLNTPAKSGTNDNITGTFSVDVDTSSPYNIRIKDADFQTSAPKALVLTFNDLRIKNSGLITPAARSPSFSIGVKTQRTS